jgi:hypothetical protein
MTNKDKILTYLRYIAPDRATNSDLRRQTGIQSHQRVYLLTQELMRERHIHGLQDGKEWVFWCDAGTSEDLAWLTAREGTNQAESSGSATPGEFEALAHRVLSKHFGVTLERAQVSGVPKTFDLVSPDGTIVDDAKYYTLVRGEELPPAKFATIAE